MRRMGVCAAIAALFVCATAAPLEAQENSARRPDFIMPAGTKARILMLRPNIQVGSQSTGGMAEPNADWSEQARAEIGRALASAQQRLGHSIVVADEPVGAAAVPLAAYHALFSTVASAVITYQFFPGNRLPTKKRKGEFDWSLGEGVRSIPGAANADYILFLATNDQYGSAGRKALQIFAAVAGVGISSGVHVGYAGLVEARTGNLVWLNADAQMGGDVRTADGAAKRVAQLLEDFPGTVPAPPASGAGSTVASK